jgi:N-formylglutamate amidohydrolase
VIELVTGYFSGLGYSVSINAPYAGTYIPRGYSIRKKKTDIARASAAKVESIMIEVNRSLYMDEKTGEKLPQFEKLQEVLRTLWTLIETFLAKREGYEL